MPRTAITILLAFTIAPFRVASAQDDEIRLTASPKAGVLRIGAFDSANTVATGGVGIGVDFWFSDLLSLGGEASYQTRFDAPLAGARMGRVGGDGFTLYTDIQDVEVTARARIHGDRWMPSRLVRWHPFVGVRAGAAFQVLGSPQLFSNDGKKGPMESSQKRLFPALGVEAGTTYRLSRRIEFGAAIQTTYSGSNRQTVMGAVDVAWLFF